MINNKARCGNFTSSEIVALTTKDKKRTSFGAPALTYIEETNMERLLGRSVSTEIDAKPTSWGKLLEVRVGDMLGLEYTLMGADTFVHPQYPYWVGSPDLRKKNTTADIKCPLTLKSFCQLVQPLYQGLTGMEAINQIRENHKDGEKFYWQLVSNSSIQGNDNCELIVYMPYFSELEEIRELARNHEQKRKYSWVDFAADDELPYLLDGGYYTNLNVIPFTPPKEDRKLLEDCVKKGGEMLITEPGKVLMAHHDAESDVTIIENANPLNV